MAGYAVSNPQVIFQQQYEAVRRDEVVGVLLALFLGGFGIHQFYLGRTGWGIFYLLLSWTPIPWVLGWIECFFMPGRVRMYNAAQAAGLAMALGIGIPGYVGYPGWVAPGWVAPGYPQAGYAQAAYAPVPADAGAETTLSACGNCRQVNATGARFCVGCGAQQG